MNCKPGDIAVVIGASRFAGRLVEVLYAAPQNDFYLPDGCCHSGSPELLGSSHARIAV